MMHKPYLLLAEDDTDLGQLLKQYLEVHNFQVQWAKTGLEALHLLKQQKNEYVLAVLDVMMPEMDGFQLAEKIVEWAPEVPFIFLTARKLKEDKLKGLKLGADDYIVKPFDVDLLILRIQNILKRTQVKSIQENKKIKIASYLLDTANHLLIRNDKMQKLTKREVALTCFLVQRKNELIKRDEILQEIWGNDDYFSGRSMDVFISRLRKYFKVDSRIEIESRRGIGLIFHINE